MELQEAIRGRRSIRNYYDKPVDDETVRKIIEAGTWAPSACNCQAWRFIVINDHNILQKLYKLGSATFVKDAHQAILVVCNNQSDNLEYRDYIQNGAAAVQNMSLMAYSLGVATCWVNNLPNKGVLRWEFDIPHYYDPIAMLTLGYPLRDAVDRPRKNKLDDLISYNRYEAHGQEEYKSVVSVGVKRIVRKLYKALPCKTVLKKLADKFEKKFDN
jgi:nitroreductase